MGMSARKLETAGPHEAKLRVDLLRTRLLSHLLQPAKGEGWQEEKAEHLARLFEAEAQLLHLETEAQAHRLEEIRSAAQEASTHPAGVVATVQASHGLC
jgi:hypothetical protein